MAVTVVFLGKLADLAGAINALADRLEQTEAARQRLVTDLAHELRTPLSAIDATVEAIADGILPADAATLRGWGPGSPWAPR